MYRKIIIFLIIASPCVLSRNHGSWKNSDEVVNDLGWLFDIEGSEKKINHAHEKDIVCKTDGCKYLGNLISKSMNKEVDPCEDFYEYVCGRWESQNPIPPHEGSWGHFQMFQGAVYDRMKAILETKPVSSDILPVRQAKKWYRGCMNMDDLEKRGIKPLESILMQIGGWPMTIDKEEWDENDHSWQDIERYYFSLTGSYIFYDISAGYGRSKEGEIEYTMTINTGDIPLSRDFPEKYRNYTGDNYDAYLDLIEGVVREFIEHNRANVELGVIEKNARDVVEFEKKLFMLNENIQYDYEETTVSELVETYRSNLTELKDSELIDLRSLLQDVFLMGNIKMNDSTRVDIMYPSYWPELTKLLNETPKKTIINYMHWWFVSNMLKYTSEKMRELLFKLKEAKFGVEERPPRWYECVKEIRMEHATSYAFVQKYFPKTTEIAALKMVEHIRTEMESQIDNSNWMNDESKKLAIDKLDTIRIFLGFPDWYRNKTAVINAYKGLTIGTNYIDNVLSFHRYSTRVKLQKIGKKNSDLESWVVSPTTVNAMYSPISNSINVPAADFQPPLFTTQLPDNINYGMVGVVIGHEIGHAFDDSGINYGKDGNDTKISKDMIELYYKRAECFLDQFNEYYGVTESSYWDTTPDDVWDYSEISEGRRTRGENIADTTGLHSLFEAYRKMSKNRIHSDGKLPGFEKFTDEQMFFIAFGTMWCTAERPESANVTDRYDSHSPNRLRVIGAVSNTNDFAKAFQCPKGTPMNPENKCNIWKSLEEDDNEVSDWLHESRRHRKSSRRW